MQSSCGFENRIDSQPILDGLVVKGDKYVAWSSTGQWARYHKNHRIIITWRVSLGDIKKKEAKALFLYSLGDIKQKSYIAKKLKEFKNEW